MSSGLEGVVAAETVLSDVDGLGGRLILRGMPLHAVAGHWRYEEIVGLLWEGFFPDLPANLTVALGDARVAVFEAVGNLLPALARRPVFDGMRAGIAMLEDDDTLNTALMVVAAPAVILPALLRLRAGASPLPPDATLSHAADMLRMANGEVPTAEQVDALDAYLVTVVDHGLNASTFAARVVASTRAGLGSAVLAALGALKGPLHGGAPGPVLDMLDEIAAAGDAEAWIAGALARGERLMGFGHRIYRVRDPRADALAGALRALGAVAGHGSPSRLDLAREVERKALAALARHRPGRALATNVEFYTALLLEALGFPREAFTAVFAAGRVGGWVAHALEEASNGRLIRPASRYVGPAPRQAA